MLLTVVDLEARLIEGDKLSYTWLPTERMWADILTKEKLLPKDLEDVLVDSKMNLGDSNINEVKAFGQEVRMTTIKNHRAVS